MVGLSAAKMAQFIKNPNQPQPHDEGNKEISSFDLATGRPWYWLARHSSVIPLFHGHSNLGASVGI